MSKEQFFQNEEFRIYIEKILEEKNELKLHHAILNTRYESEIQSSAEKLNAMQNAKDELSKEFKILANQIFEDKSKQFNHVHKEQFEMLLKPFREQISNFSTQSKEQFNYETRERHLLKNELLRLKEMNQQLSSDAVNLTKALKGENKTQGNWGEIVLERILEQSGLRKGIEYETQSTLKNDEGKVYRPDVVIKMPQERDIIIDSKVSLNAYERFISAENETLKSLALKEHLASIASHVRELSAKKYERLGGINTLDYVLLFMPIEGAFMLALSEDGEFFKKAYENNILVVSPSTLLVTLRTIEHIWRTQKQQDHAKKIADEAEAMYEKLVGFVDEMQNIGSFLQKAQGAHENAMKRLSTGRGNIIKRAQNMKELGLKPKTELRLLSEDDV
ncbi:MAG: DNA recombination protein RmuC [Sulfurimonas sp.]|nr:DNA recombination protein RmuC [Sulfurimonas sp.]MBU1218039.1 DNA recombination protein RmuC [bacterium]MBU1434798.1 DNA recombination protein RmuC [bacterium]MBU1502786.1 DNA recombination protein RmuC [bacterium]MBU3940092.1 DNA recombination protein RmuC [bacterium]